MRITDLLALSHVPRWANVRHNPSQSVADHSFRVGVIYWELCQRLGKEPSLRGLTCAMFHDGMESYTGDIPGDFKKDIAEEVHKAEAKLGVVFCEPPNTSELAMVKLADKIETYTFIAVNGLGPHANRVRDIVYRELQTLAGEYWAAVKMLAIDIIEETERN